MKKRKLSERPDAGNSHVRLVGCLIWAFLCLPGLAEEPLFRAGWLSDTHTGSTRTSFERLEKALKLFRERKVDAVIHNGDISQRYDPAGYAIYRQVMDEAFAGAEKKPIEIYAWAWHDVEGRKGNDPSIGHGAAWRKEGFTDVAKRLGIRHRMTDRFEIGGHVFVLSPQFLDDVEWKNKKGLSAYELLLQEAERDCGDRPIFVIDHVPPARTVANSASCDEWKRTLYAKHPGIISLSGHTHGTLWDENQIWQGEFTAVNAACLSSWDGDPIGLVAPAMRSYGVVVIEGFRDRVVFRRFDVRDGEEFVPGNPWIVPYPFDPKTAPYSLERRAKVTSVPMFAEDAQVAVRVESSGDLTLVMPPLVAGADSAYRYRASVSEKTADGWRNFKTAESYTQFHLRPFERQKEELMSFPAGYFEAGRRYRFEVSPVNFFGVAGKPAYAEAIAPGPKSAKLIWECLNPMEELRFVYGDEGTDNGTSVEKKDGWYQRTSESRARMVIPPEAWIAPMGSKLCFTIDMDTVQDSDPRSQTYRMRLMRLNPSVELAGGCVRTPYGASGLQRYVIEFIKGKDVPYNLFFFQGITGKIRFRSVKVVGLDP